MQIQGLGHIHGPQHISAPHTMHGPAAPQTPASRDSLNVDQLDISPQADMVSRTRDIPEIRQERVDSIRQQIASGTYDSSEKLDIALSRLLDELA
jgi:anti-sigma28 factor (negative regulator of flagellin synthesis)